MLAQITTYVADVGRRLLSQYRGKFKLQAAIEVAAARAQDLEEQLWLLLLSTSIGYYGPPVGSPEEQFVSPATGGVWLNYLGARVGEPRPVGLDDGSYATRIAARVRANRSSGSIPDLLYVLELVSEGAPTPLVREQYPAGVEIDIGEERDLTEATNAAYFMRLARSAGVGVMVLHNQENDALTFTFSSTDALEASAFQGFGNSADPDTGGTFAGAIRA